MSNLDKIDTVRAEAIRQGWARLVGDEMMLTRDGQTASVAAVDPPPPEPKRGRNHRGTPEGLALYQWWNAYAGEYHLRIHSTEETAAIVPKAAEAKRRRDEISAELDEVHAAFRRANPVIPFSRGGLAALIAADRPS